TIDSPALLESCDAALEAGVILVAAAGNERLSINIVTFPAAYESVIAVAATTQYDTMYVQSSQGEEVDIAAPGVSILSTVPDGGYNFMSGTSMAAAHVTGTLALRISDDLLTGGMGDLEYYRNLLYITAEDIGALPIDAGYGLVDAAKLVTGEAMGDNLPL
ncbi:MAG: S8 family serine peptidase, partial [Deltaproteobacteria bacterium]